MLPLNICFSQNMKAKIQGLGQEVRIAFESIESYIKSCDLKIEQLYKENSELKARLDKSVELYFDIGDKIYVIKSHKIKCYTIKRIEIWICEEGKIVDYIGEYGCEYIDFKKEAIGETVFLSKKEANQALKGCVDYE